MRLVLAERFALRVECHTGAGQCREVGDPAFGIGRSRRHDDHEATGADALRQPGREHRAAGAGEATETDGFAARRKPLRQGTNRGAAVKGIEDRTKRHSVPLAGAAGQADFRADTEKRKEEQGTTQVPSPSGGESSRGTVGQSATVVRSPERAHRTIDGPREIRFARVEDDRYGAQGILADEQVVHPRHFRAPEGAPLDPLRRPARATAVTRSGTRIGTPATASGSRNSPRMARLSRASRNGTNAVPSGSVVQLGSSREPNNSRSPVRTTHGSPPTVASTSPPGAAGSIRTLRVIRLSARGGACRCRSVPRRCTVPP